VIDYSPLYRELSGTPLEHWLDDLPAALQQRLEQARRHGDLPCWQA